jgi:putative ABC transport system permease protein
MLKMYFKIAWRNLAKNKLYSLVNIGGLTIGITSCILIGLYISNELSYDRFHKNAGRIVRATTEYTTNGVKYQVGSTASNPGPRLAVALPQVESYVRILSFEPYAVRYGDKNFVENRFLFADSTFFKIFSFPLIEGDATTALDGPGKIVLSESTKKKYFGNEKALGKLLHIGGIQDYIVSGVAKDAPENSQIKFNLVASYSSTPAYRNPQWNSEIYQTYFLLKNKNYDLAGIERNIAGYMHRQKDLDLAGNDYLIYHLEPMTMIHLYSPFPTLEPNGNITYIYILAAVALLILCIAAVNYTNLATAQSVRRLPEIGIRKVMGSAKWQLFWQFIGESLLVNLFSFLCAFCVALMVLPAFNQLVERNLEIGMLFNPAAIALTVLLYLVISFIAGTYPAFILSNIKLIKVLKAGFSFSGKSGTLRRSLIVFQFIVSVFLIISTIVIFRQLSFIRNKNLGYDKDHVVVLPVDNVIRNNYDRVKEAIKLLPNVQSVSCGAEELTNVHWDDEVKTTTDASSTPLYVNASPTDIDFVKTMGLHIVAGSDFTLSDWKQTDTLNNPDPHTSYMINESLAKALGWTPEQAVGKIIYRSGSNKGIIKAVVKDFHYAPLHETIGRLLIFLDPYHRHIFQAYVKISGNDVPGTLRKLEATWKERVPHRPFQYHFLDDNYNIIYHNEQQSAKIFSTFSSLAILLACLGLFALAAYSTVQRAKEIGIRKVLGADVMQIVTLIAGDFIKLVVIAAVIAFPLAWLSMHSWLQGFAYRVNMGWWVFLVAGVCATVIALLSISFQAVRAANMNPVKSLKSE